MAIQPRKRLPVHILRIIWILLVIYYERVAFHVSVHSCEWPDDLLPESLNSAGQPRPEHILLVADPQILDAYSYPRRSPILSSLTKLIVDLNMKKNWDAALRKSPDAVVFLGDMMDGGRRDIPTEQYEGLATRFAGIFQFPQDLPVYFIPGNHDIGIGTPRTFKQSPQAYQRYVKQFGQPNQIVSIANHSLVLFDAPSHVREDSQRHGQRKKFEDWIPIPGGSYEFAERFGKVPHHDPIILFTHIPFYRPDGKSCGPLRERGSLRPGAGDGYQNTIEKDSSIRLLENIKPVAIFSGDDHDYCEYVHHFDLGNGIPRITTEISVKSFSMTMGVRRPGFQLLSLAPAQLRDPKKPTYADEPCLLPDQIQVYLQRYLVFLVLSLLSVAILNFDLNFSRGSRAQQYAVLPDLEESKEEGVASDDEAAPSFSSYALPTPTTSSDRPPRSRGWLIPPTNPRIASSTPSKLTRSVRSFWPGNLHAHSRRRRSWAGRVLRDIRDIAIPSLCLFILLNWWVMTW
ncbi:Metallo-dependent phosphatase-like protein [Crepidotus variabilis]|uniref:Metallo-dependent phosphatase-like protein n=1 Tax=Crepidotus variabilis TaxID=179855 RepID=A0A9P6EBX1_9AGAR|nr:Metallo-dependent phosphatase-like protein [Crepidotus variabilis]